MRWRPGRRRRAFQRPGLRGATSTPFAQGRSGIILLGSAERRGAVGGGMGMTCHVMEECFNQHLFILSKESERWLGLPHSIVQKRAPSPTMLSSERCRTFFWEPNAPPDKGCSSTTRLAPPHPPSRALSCGLMTTKAARAHTHCRCLTGRPTDTAVVQDGLTPPSQNCVVTVITGSVPSLSNP